mmetsp:Transcript_40953/g.60147  ORF Transcript_40953/g.60147 Transcript_40953/m.60147 type:complete len:114 (+) Transcript_40953:518-859(+)
MDLFASLFNINLSSASCTNRSDSESSALVASSSRRMDGRLKMARAIAIRCFCPPLSCNPRSPTWVLYPFGKDVMKECALASLAACMAFAMAVSLPLLSSSSSSSKPSFAVCFR